ncbi:hypothetical protein DRE_01060 [Drechslerella stenobrocha 248]|uniref:Telomeric single stranded DNA binding POT1/Cdc13 domain-containing protein n=1 Tax=Drechslerella stenobrocha 248 TaxID=1043628 RepID=W7HMA5_9PEZI|nr:hypothetical protein DRE_01060 [Drechslerella stenobrocha 248]
MPQGRRKLILLLGAPTSSSLLSSSETLLLCPTSPFDPVPAVDATRLEDYLGTGTLPSLSTFNPSGDGEANQSSRLKPVPISPWRILPLQKPQLHTGFTQRVYDPTPSIYAWKQRCFTFSEDSQASSPMVPLSPSIPHLLLDDDDVVAVNDSAEDNGSSVLERSYAVHNLPSSQVPLSNSPPPTASSPGLRSGSVLEETTFYDEDTLPAPLPPIPIAKLTDIEDLPSPARLLNPYKTFSATLLVGIMKAESQIIKTKYQNAANPSGLVELITFTVGDHTSAGLQIKIWLSLSDGQPTTPGNPALIPGLAKSRCFVRGDIVLFQDLALATFNGVVYANSLRRERSKVTLIYREKRGFRVDLSDPEDMTVEKVRRLREWVRGYIGCEGDSAIASGIPMESF